MENSRILLIDSDPVARRFLRAHLEARGFDIFTSAEGYVEALHVINSEAPDMVMLDMIFPEGNWLDFCRRLREASTAPVVVLSSRTDESWKVKCFEAGADDFITKPFGIEELVARLRALLRRTGNGKQTTHEVPSRFQNGGLEIRFRERQVNVGEREVRLTPTEYSLLQELARNPDKVLPHTVLLHKVWGPEYNQEREYLRVFIGRLRKKLETEPGEPSQIVTVPWVGYKLSTNPDAVMVKA